MAKPENDWWELGHYIVGMRGAIQATLGGDILGQSLISQARTAISILDASALLPR